MKNWFVFTVLFSFSCASAAGQQSATAPNAHWSTCFESGVCVIAPDGWHVTGRRIVGGSVEIDMERNDIGRITVMTKARFDEAWAERIDELRADGETRARAFPAGWQHVVVLEQPLESRNEQFAVSEAIRIANSFDYQP